MNIFTLLKARELRMPLYREMARLFLEFPTNRNVTALPIYFDLKNAQMSQRKRYDDNMDKISTNRVTVHAV